MSATIDIITLGVDELAAAQAFYEGGFGVDVGVEDDTLAVRFGPNAARLALRPWRAVAEEAGAHGQTNGFRAFTLSYILESADEVDEILSRVARHGGRVSKPPKNAVWGYSAYVTDPSDYLWKIASSQRRPLITRKASATNNGHVITAQVVPITIGVADVRRA